MASPTMVPLRRSARFQQRKSCNPPSKVAGTANKRQRLLSPSITSSIREKPRPQGQTLTELDSHLGPEQAPVSLDNRGLRPTRARETRVEDDASLTRTAQSNSTRKGTSTGTRKPSAPKPTEQGVYESVEEPAKTLSPQNRPFLVSCACSERGEQGDCDPIAHWAITGLWPKNFSQMDPAKASYQSYAQLTRCGAVPKSDSPAFEEYLEQMNIIMNEMDGRNFIHETSRQLCEEMLEARYENPTHAQFPVSQFEAVWSRLRTRNEYQIHQAITPLVVPPPEFLFFNGHQNLEHLVQEVCADWTKSQPLAGPVPRPDFAVGIRSSALSHGELEKMQCYSSWRRGTMFTKNMYFPFLVCEVKACTQDISGAERQSVRGCAMAVDAIIQLHLTLGEAEASKLSGQVLAISVTHDQTWVLIYGHYAIIAGDQATHYRYPIMGAKLALGGGPIAGWKMAHDFVRGVYDKFYPNHLKRIKDALAQLPDPEVTSRVDSRSMRWSRAEFNGFSSGEDAQQKAEREADLKRSYRLMAEMMAGGMAGQASPKGW